MGANRDGIVGRNIDADLTPEGRAQAVSLGKHLSQDLTTAFEKKNIIVTPCVRTKQTAMAALEGAGIRDARWDFVEREELNEIHRGDLEGKSIAEVSHFITAMKDCWDDRTPGDLSESKREVLDRCLCVLNELEEKGKNGETDTVYVFCHFVVIQVLIWHIMGSGGHELNIQNTSSTMLTFQPYPNMSSPSPPTAWAIHEINQTTHLWEHKIENKDNPMAVVIDAKAA